MMTLATTPAALRIDDEAASAPTAPRDRVPVGEKCVYGMAGAVTLFEGHLPKTLASPVFVVMLGLSPTWVSMAMLVFKLYDAFLTPMVGWLSDNTRSRWGRRRPWMFVGAILTGLWLPVMWLVGPHWTPHQQIGWFVFTGLVLYTFGAIFATPYESLNLELTPDYDERTSVNSFKAFFQKISGLLIGWAWFITLLPMFNDASGKPNALRGALGLTIAAGILVAVLGSLPAIFVRERFYKLASTQPKVPLRDNFKYTLSSRPFLLLTSMSVLFITATYLSGGISFYLRLYYVTGGNQSLSAKITGVESTLVMALGIASIPLFAFLARRVGKKAALMIAMGTTLVGTWTSWFFYDPRWPWLSLAGQIFLAPSITGIWQMIPSMTGDIVDHDELRTGERREGAFASIYSWIVKTAFTAGVGLAGPVVEACGFDLKLGTAQTASTIQAMRVTFAILPATVLGVAMLVLWRYPLSRARVAEIRDALEARRGRV